MMTNIPAQSVDNHSSLDQAILLMNNSDFGKCIDVHRNAVATSWFMSKSCHEEPWQKNWQAKINNTSHQLWTSKQQECTASSTNLNPKYCLG
jgi:hypothetical protein